MQFYQFIGYIIHDRVRCEYSGMFDINYLQKTIQLLVESIEIDGMTIIKEDFIEILRKKVQSDHYNYNYNYHSSFPEVNCKLYLYDDINQNGAKIEKDTNNKSITIDLFNYDLYSEATIFSKVMESLKGLYMIHKSHKYHIILENNIFLACFAGRIETCKTTELDIESYQKCIEELKIHNRINNSKLRFANYVINLSYEIDILNY